MVLIETLLTMEEGGIIRIPKVELEKMGIRTGDQICLSYLAKEDGSLENKSKELLVESV